MIDKEDLKEILNEHKTKDATNPANDNNKDTKLDLFECSPGIFA